MRTDGHGLALASFQTGTDDSHGVATTVLNSGAFSSSSSSLNLLCSQSKPSLGEHSVNDMALSGDLDNRKEAWLQYQNTVISKQISIQDRTSAAMKMILLYSPEWAEDNYFVSAESQFEYLRDEADMLHYKWVDETNAKIETMRTVGQGLALASCQSGPDDFPGVANQCLPSGNTMIFRPDMEEQGQALHYIESLDKATVHALLRHKISLRTGYPSVIKAVLQELTADGREKMNAYLHDECQFHWRTNPLLNKARKERTTCEKIESGGHHLTTALRQCLDKVDELLTCERRMYSTSDRSIDVTLRHFIPKLRHHILAMPHVSRRLVDFIMD
jgi:hypothetical protein